MTEENPVHSVQDFLLFTMFNTTELLNTQEYERLKTFYILQCVN